METEEIKNNIDTYCTLEILKEQGIVSMHFKGFIGPEEMKSALLKSHDLFTSRPGVFHSYIIDLKDVSGPFGDAEWAKKVWTPMAIKAGIIASAAIVGDEIFTKMSADDMIEATIGDYRRKVFENYDEGIAWLVNLKP